MSIPRNSRVLAISGGIGGAKLALGLSKVLESGHLSVAVNTGDDFLHLGLNISPDIDTLMYTLAGLNDTTRGWGLAGETWAAMEAVAKLGGDSWFSLGDRDLATHLLRSQALKAGHTLSEVTARLCQALDVGVEVLPMTDDPVATMVITDEGELAFQDYFVRLQCEPKVTSVHFQGAAAASPLPRFMQLLQDPALEAVVICPSNPYLSVDPFLALPGVRQALADTAVPVIAVSPIVGGEAIKGPTAKMMAELGVEISPRTVMAHYADFLDTFVIDHRDATLADSMAGDGIDIRVTNTVMQSLEDKVAVARACLEYAGVKA